MFKVGDKVQRIRCGWYGLEVGDIVEVTEVFNSVTIKVKGGNARQGYGYSAEYFKLVEPETPDFESYELLYGSDRHVAARYDSYEEAEERAKGLVDGGCHESMTIVGCKRVEIATVNRPPVCAVVTKHT